MRFDSRHAISLEQLRRSANWGLQVLLWCHVPLIFAVAVLVGRNPLLPTCLAFALVAASAVTWWSAGSGQATRLVVGVALMGSIAVLVGEMAGQPWQTDMHMYFFCGLAMLASYCDWRAIAAAGATVALHHLLLNEVLPWVLYPGGADLGRVLLHGGLIAIECGALIWASKAVIRLLEHVEDAQGQLRRAGEQAVSLRAALEERAVRERRDHARALTDRFDATVKQVVGGLAEATDGMQRMAHDLSSVAGHTSEQAESAACVSDGVAGSVSGVAAAATQLTASVTGLAAEMGMAVAVVRDAVEGTEQTRVAVSELASAAVKIDEVFQLINRIAHRTNLLALNASIEAARAGPAGRSFAVVAAEVKALAGQTAVATAEVRDQLVTVRMRVQPAIAAIDSISVSLVRLDEVTLHVATAVTDQSDAARSIEARVREAAQGSSCAAETLTRLARSVNAVGVSTMAAREAAAALSALSGQLGAEMDGFVSAMLAAA